MGKHQKKLPMQEYLCERLKYDESSGELYWRKYEHNPIKWNSRFSGKKAFAAITNSGYHEGRLDGQTYLAHRIIWKMLYGGEPIQIDHINHDRLDNRKINLRNVTPSENNHNQRLSPRSSSGICGVYWDVPHGKWVARIKVGNTLKCLGYYSDIMDAKQARLEANAKYGYHKNHGKPIGEENGHQV